MGVHPHVSELAAVGAIDQMGVRPTSPRLGEMKCYTCVITSPS